MVLEFSKDDLAEVKDFGKIFCCVIFCQTALKGCLWMGGNPARCGLKEWVGGAKAHKKGGLLAVNEGCIGCKNIVGKESDVG